MMIKNILAQAACVAILSALVWTVCNVVFDIPISYLQAVGLYVLTGLLFRESI